MTPRLALVVSLLACAALAAAQDVASPSCRPGFTCPGTAGRVDVNLAGFDGSGALANEPNVLDADEIQCALDCLDGDPDPDHVLAGPKAPRTATPVRGGTIVFDPTATYRLQRGLRLPAASSGPLRIDGNGARLRVAHGDKKPIAMLSRMAPPGATNCDVEAMCDWATLWTIENLMLEGDGSDTDQGIVIHGTNSLTVRNCQMASMGVGIDLRFGLLAVIDGCVFINNRRHDVYLGSGDAEPGPAATAFSSCATGSQVFTSSGSSTKQLVESGCNGALVRRCRFLMHPQQLASVRIRNSRQPVIDGAMFDGYRGRHAVHYSHYLASDLTIRDMYFETNIASTDAVIRFDGGNRLLVEGLHLVSGETLVAVDTADNAGCAVTLRQVPWLPANVTFRNGSNPWRNEWRFEDVSAQDLETPARWTGGPPPRALVADRVRRELRGETQATRSLMVPVGSPAELGGKLEDGQIWLDSKTKKLMYCCDESGKPRPVGK